MVMKKHDLLYKRGFTHFHTSQCLKFTFLLRLSPFKTISEALADSVCLIFFLSPLTPLPFLLICLRPCLPPSNLRQQNEKKNERKEKLIAQTLLCSSLKLGEQTQIQPSHIYSWVLLQMVICPLSTGAPLMDTAEWEKGWRRGRWHVNVWISVLLICFLYVKILNIDETNLHSVKKYSIIAGYCMTAEVS